jgi:hypothetical protein
MGKGIRQVLLTGNVSVRQPSPQEKQIEEPSRERLVKTVKDRGKPWAIAALVDGSIGYHSVESAERIVDDLLASRSLGGSERCMCCFRNDGVAEVDHDFRYFGNKDENSADRVRVLVNYVKEVLRMNRKRGRPRTWIEQTTESMLYPTSNLRPSGGKRQ